ncbi:transcriptional regulator FtrA [Phenylobacterium sp.]|jgi:AraC family transcriptional activator FtrA|uniref:transcriptional regulator FtrA n=1 Tax=Phenylobacterium sp. TaxID=1871053 RepID=UPI002E2ECEFF|nr:transcriptional regulator FtrA [Phenylobacterium sp.]HEX4709001.1 transcriptional regulator FtrA [Phenylobacterium sp.]
MPKRHNPQKPTANLLVAVLVYDGLCTFEYGIAVEVFGLPRPELGPGWYRLVTCAVEPGPMRACGGLRVEADQGLEALETAGTIIVPGWKGPDVAPPRPLIEALQRAHARGARLVSICSGVFVLAATGLLKNRRVTTHWRYAGRLAAAFPDVIFDADVLYIDEGQILTSAGSAAGLDLALHLVRRDHGPDIANHVARRLVMPAHRNGGQRQYVEKPVAARERSRLSDLLDEMRDRLEHPYTISELARSAAMSERTFNRRFLDATGQTPGAWLVMARVDRARALLESGDLSIEEVARRSGFGGPATLRHHFRRQLGVSPTDYREQFGAAGRRLAHEPTL